MKKHSFFATLFLLISILLSSHAVSAEDELADRITRLEKKLDSKVLIEIVNEIESIRRELQQLRGDVEQQNHNVEQMEKRQQNIFDDLDSRVRTLEGDETSQMDEGNIEQDEMTETANEYSDNNDAVVSSQDVESTTDDAIENANAIMPVESFTGGSAKNEDQQSVDQDQKQIIVSSGDEEASYSEAFNMLKEGNHEGSIEKFNIFITQFPESNYADNAQYWMGEAYYARRQFESAVKEYKKLLKIYPDSGKASHALLKIGYSYDELDEKDLAEGELEDLISRYPGTSAANLAQQRLDHIRTE